MSKSERASTAKKKKRSSKTVVANTKAGKVTKKYTKR